MGGLRKSRIQFCLQKLAPSNIEAIAKVNYFQTFIFAIMCDMQKKQRILQSYEMETKTINLQCQQKHTPRLWPLTNRYAIIMDLFSFERLAFPVSVPLPAERPDWALLSVKHPRRAETMRDQREQDVQTINQPMQINWRYEDIKPIT